MRVTLTIAFVLASASVARADEARPEAARPPRPTSAAAPAPAPRLPALTLASRAREPSPAAVLARVERFYADADHLVAKFRQEVDNVTFGRRYVADGTLWVARPGKRRWEYLAERHGRARASVISHDHDDEVWLIDHDHAQVVLRDLHLAPTPLVFLDGDEDLARNYDVALDASGNHGRSGDRVLVLTPRAPSAWCHALYLVVAPDSGRVRESIVIDAAGNTNHVRFYEQDFETPVRDALFGLSPRSPALEGYGNLPTQ